MSPRTVALVAAVVWQTYRRAVDRHDLAVCRRRAATLAADLAEETDLRRAWGASIAAPNVCCVMTDCRAVQSLEGERDRARWLAAALEQELADVAATPVRADASLRGHVEDEWYGAEDDPC